MCEYVSLKGTRGRVLEAMEALLKAIVNGWPFAGAPKTAFTLRGRALFRAPNFRNTRPHGFGAQWAKTFSWSLSGDGRASAV